MKNRFGRIIIKRIALICYSTDLKITRFILKSKGEPSYKLGGNCELCARCCESPMIQTNRIFFNLKTIRWLMLTWHKIVNGFEYQGEIWKKNIFIFRCTHFNPKTKKCDSYNSRPGMCRDYPRGLLYSTNPEFFPECSFYPIHKNKDRFKESLQRVNLPEKEMEELQKKLHLMD